MNPGIGSIRAGLGGSGFFNGLVTANSFSVPSSLVSFPLGLGPPSIPLVVPNSTGFPNGFGVLKFNNGFAFDRGFINGSFGIEGSGFGSGNVGVPFAILPYGPAYDYQVSPSYQASPNVVLILYSPQSVVQMPSDERDRPARPVIHEYDQSGREIPSAGSLSPAVAQADPPKSGGQPLSADRGRSVIHDYDGSGREIPPAGFLLYLIAFVDHTIHTAISYRVDGNTLNYLTPDREEKAVQLNTVDRSLSTQLNRERQVPFELPPQ